MFISNCTSESGTRLILVHKSPKKELKEYIIHYTHKYNVKPKRESKSEDTHTEGSSTTRITVRTWFKFSNRRGIQSTHFHYTVGTRSTVPLRQ